MARQAGAVSLSFLFGRAPEAQRQALQDLTVIRAKDSKTVRHGVDMIRCWGAAKGSMHAALEAYLIEALRYEAYEDPEKKWSAEERKEKERLLEAVMRRAADQ